MKARIRTTSLLLTLTLFGMGREFAAQTAEKPYHLAATIELPGVQGGFDHFAYDPAGQRLFLAASDNGTLEVMDLKSNKRITSVHGFVNPHSVLLRPKTGQILITDSGEHRSGFLDATTLKRTKNIDLALGANCILLDPNGARLYITAGGDRVKQADSVLQAINPDTGAILKTVHVPALHLQPMAIDGQTKRLFVNLADQNAIGIFNSDSLERIGTWHIPKGYKNSPIAFDKADGTLFVIASDPGILLALDAASGTLRESIPTPPSPDDMGFDLSGRRLFVPGEAALKIYQVQAGGSVRLLQQIETGAEARTGIFLPDRRAFAVAVPASTTLAARVLVFSPTK